MDLVHRNPARGARSRFSNLVVLAATAVAVITSAVLLLPADSLVRAGTADVSVAVAACVAAVATLYTVRATRGFDRTGWLLFAAGVLCWSVAEWIWAYDEIILKTDPFPSIADAFYLGGTLFLVSGMTMVGSQRRWHAQLRALFEGSSLALALTAVGWAFVMEPTMAGSTGTRLEVALATAYPVTDITLLWAVITLAYRVGLRRDASVFLGLGGGVAAFVAADSAFLYADLRGGYTPGFIDAGWMAGYLLVGIGAFTRVRSGIQVAREDERQVAVSRAHNLVPIFTAAAMIGLGAYVGWDDGFGAHRVSLALIVVVLGLALVRQLVVILDNLNLNAGLERMRVQLEAQVQELATARDSADTANAAKSQFLSRMSHELRTPMNAVLGFGQLLQLEDLTPEQRENVDYIMSSGQHLLRLIDEVLDISRIEAGRMKVEIAPVRCGDVIGQVMEMTAPLAAAAHITLRRDDGPDVTGVLADAARLKQVLLNLVSNAIKYNEAGGTVVIRSGVTRAGRVAISVVDNGPGIAPEKMSRMFNPFERLDADRRGIEGTGLGLVLSKALVEAMYGSIQVDSVPGKGTRFTVFLPLARRSGEAAPAGARTAPLSILHIDGDWSRRQLVERVLARRTGVKLVQAENTIEGKLLSDSWRAFTVVVDAGLPNVQELIGQHIRRPGAPNARARLVVLGPRDRDEFERSWKPLGCDAFLPVPLEPEDLIRVLEAADRTAAA